jgi:hypothetical protein
MKTEHTNFSESTEAIKPLTPEEKVRLTLEMCLGTFLTSPNPFSGGEARRTQGEACCKACSEEVGRGRRGKEPRKSPPDLRPRDGEFRAVLFHLF